MTAAPDDAQAWAVRRREAAAERAAALERAQAAELRRAHDLIEQFIRAATERGVRPGPLLARGYPGRARYRTPLRGWYLRRDQTVGVDADGNFYLLSVPATLLARVRGASPVPTDPPLILGRGGRDGESIDLADALAHALEPPP